MMHRRPCDERFPFTGPVTQLARAMSGYVDPLELPSAYVRRLLMAAEQVAAACRAALRSRGDGGSDEG